MDMYQLCTNTGCVRHREDLVRQVHCLQRQIEQYQSQIGAAGSPPASSRPFAQYRPFSPASTPPPQQLYAAHLDQVPEASLDIDIQTPTNFQPTTDVSAVERTKADQRRNPKRKFPTFFEGIPCSNKQWTEKRECLGLTNIKGIVEAFDDVMSWGCQAEPSSQRSMTGIMSDYITHRANKRLSSVGDLQRAECLSRFDALVTIGEYCVAIQLPVNLELVDKAVSLLVKSRPSSGTLDTKTLQMYRKTPGWIARQVNQLYTQYGHRASEMFLHATMTISTYDSLARSIPDTEFQRKVTDAMKPAETPAVPEEELQAQLPFYLPFVIWARILLHTNIDCYDKLQVALGSSNLFSRGDFQRWLGFYQQNTTKAFTWSTTTRVHVDEAEPAPRSGTGHKRRRTDLPPKPTSKRQRTDTQSQFTLTRRTAVPVQTGVSSLSPPVDSIEDKSMCEQAGVSVSRDSSGFDMTDAGTTYFGEHLLMNIVEDATLNACPPYYPQTLFGTVPRTEYANHGFPNSQTLFGTPLIDSISRVTQPPAQIRDLGTSLGWSQYGGINSTMCGVNIDALIPVGYENRESYIRC